MDVGHLSRDADLVAVEVVGLLSAFAVFVGPVADLCQGFVAVGIGIEIGISAVRLVFLQEVATIPNESGFRFEASAYILRKNWRFHAGYSLLITLI